MIIGEKIKILRTEKHFTQKKLATFMNVEATTVQKWEKGKNLPPLPEIQNLACILDVDIRVLTNDNITLNESAHTDENSIKLVCNHNRSDSKHKIFDSKLRLGAKLHRFTNASGETYSAIYVGNYEYFSCPRKDEKDMIIYWNKSNM